MCSVYVLILMYNHQVALLSHTKHIAYILILMYNHQVALLSHAKHVGAVVSLVEVCALLLLL